MESEALSKSMAKDQAAGTGFGEGQYSPTYRVAFDPLKELSLISDEYNKFEMEGSLLADTTKPYDALLGQFGRIEHAGDQIDRLFVFIAQLDEPQFQRRGVAKLCGHR